MIKNSLSLFFLFFILFTSSAFAAERAPASPKGTPNEIEITSNIAKKHIPQGATYPVRISIRNNSQDPIIPLGFWAAYKGGEDVDGSKHIWSKRIYGQLTFSEKEDLYRLYTMGQMESFGMLQTKLLFPKETLVFEKELKFLRTGKADIDLGFLYLKGDLAKVSKAIYIQHDSSSPSNIIYKSPTADELKAYQRQKPPFEMAFIVREPTTLENKTVVSSAAVEIESLGLSLEDAFKKVGFTTPVYTFSFWKNSWVLEKDNKLYIVDVQGVRVYPHTSIDIFKFIESSSPTVYFVTYDVKAFEKIRHMFLGYDIKEHKAIHLRVPRDAALDICEYLHNLKFEVSLSQFDLTQAIEIKEVKR